jgi:hypothetical protein
MQGFYFAMPLSAQNVPGVVRAWSPVDIRA